MKQKFNNLCLDFNLPPYLREMLWRSGIIGHADIAQIIFNISHSGFMTTEAEARTFIEEAIQSIEFAQKYGQEFFGYNKGVIPPAAYYDLLARSAIQLAPEIAGSLPEQYRELATARDRLDSNPAHINNAGLHPAARFCYKLEQYSVMQRYYRHLQKGITDINSQQTRDIYRQFVLPVKDHCRSGSALTTELQNLARKIDFIANNNTDPMFWFILMGMQDRDNVLDKQFVVQKSGLPDFAIDTFKQSYAIAEECWDDDTYDAFYNIAEKTINPMSLLIQQRQAYRPAALKYVFAHATLAESNDHDDCFDVNTRVIHEAYTNGIMDNETLRPLGVGESDFRLISNAMLMNDLILASSFYWGEKVTPFLRQEDMETVYELLKKSESVHLTAPDLVDFWAARRRQTVHRYNATAQEFSSLGFEIYHDPNFYPANDIGSP